VRGVSTIALSVLIILSVLPGRGAAGNRVKLPEPLHAGTMSLEETLNARESVRRFSDEPLTLEEISQLLWACAGRSVDGVSAATRTFPSAGGIYPLTIWIHIAELEGLDGGVYRYEMKDHSVEMVKRGDYRKILSDAALGQYAVQHAPVCIIITAAYGKTGMIYGDRGRVRYVHMDAGHAGQNIYLQATALGLGTVAIGAFRDADIKNLLDLKKEEPLYIFPVGNRK
jgi:SagB-type dehydrogenase family enzyme